MQKIHHPPGHDNHGVHVCHKCGWSFPNPHPSAKHRRAHKKVCGKIEGFEVENNTHFTVSDDDSDEDRSSSGLKGQRLEKDEKGSGAIEGEVEGASRSEEEVFSDAAADFGDMGSSLVVETVESADSNIEMKSDDKAGDNALDPPSGTTGSDPVDAAFMSGSVIQPATDSERKSDDVGGDNALEVSSGATGSDPVNAAVMNGSIVPPATDSERKSDDQGGDNALEVSSGGPDMKVDGKSNEDEGSCIPARSFAQIDSELQEVDAFPVSVVPSLLTSDDTIKLPEAAPADVQGESAHLSLEQKPWNEIFASTHLGSIEVEAHKHLDASADTVQAPQGSPRVDAVQPQEGSPHVDAVLPPEASSQVDDVQPPKRVQHVSSVQETNVQNPNEAAEGSFVHRDRDESLRLEDVTFEKISEMKPSVDLQETDPIIFHGQEEQTDSMGHEKPQNELSSSTYAEMTKVEAGEEANFGNPSDTVENSYIVHGHGSENLTTLPNPADVRNISNTKSKVDLQEADSQILCRQEVLTDSLGQQKPQNEMFLSACSGTTQGKAGEFTQQVMKGRIQVEEANVDTMVGSNLHGDFDEEEKPAPPVANLSATTISEMNPEASKDQGPVELEVALTSCDAEVVGTEDVDSQEEVHLGLVSVKSEENGNIFPSTMKVAEDSTGAGTHDVLTIDQSGSDGVSGKGKTHGGPQSSETADESLLLDRTDADSVNGKPVVSKAICPNDAVMASGIGATVSDFEERAAESSSGEQESRISHEIQPEDLIVDAAGTSNMKSTTAAAAEVLQETTTESSGYDVVDKEARHIDANLDNEYSQEGSRDEESSDSRTHPESASEITERKPQFYADLGTDKVERDLKLTESTLLGEIVGPEETHVSTSHVESSLGHTSYESSQQIASDICSDPTVKEVEVQVAGNEIDSRLPETHPDEPTLDQSIQLGSCQSTAPRPTYEKDVTSTVDKASAQGVLTLQNIKTKDFVEGEATDSHLQSLQEESCDILKQHSNASVLTKEMSVDSLSQIDSVEGNWGSVSDGTVPSTRDASDAPVSLTSESQSQVNVQTSNANVKGNVSREHQNNDTDVFEPPSFMTLVEPSRGDSGQPASAEIQSLQNSQRPNSPSSQVAWFPSRTNVVNESEGRKKNEEIIAKVANWNAGKPHTPLKSLLVSANLERKQKSPTQDPKIMNTHKDQTSKDDAPAKPATDFSTVSGNEGTTMKEWNSPARLPDSMPGKTKVKGRAYWVPFVCCSSVNKL